MKSHERKVCLSSQTCEAAGWKLVRRRNEIVSTAAEISQGESNFCEDTRKVLPVLLEGWDLFVRIRSSHFRCCFHYYYYYLGTKSTPPMDVNVNGVGILKIWI